MDDVFAKSAKRVVKARDSRLRSRPVSIVLIDRRHCYSTRRALIVSPAVHLHQVVKCVSVVVADHLGALELRLRYPLHLCVIAHPRFAVNVRESRLRRRLVRVLLASCTSYVLCCDQVC